jgi:hypothetical protein
MSNPAPSERSELRIVMDNNDVSPTYDPVQTADPVKARSPQCRSYTFKVFLDLGWRRGHPSEPEYQDPSKDPKDPKSPPIVGVQGVTPPDLNDGPGIYFQTGVKVESQT